MCTQVRLTDMVDSLTLPILHPPCSTVVSSCPQTQGSSLINYGGSHVIPWHTPLLMEPNAQAVDASWAAKLEVRLADPVPDIQLQIKPTMCDISIRTYVTSQWGHSSAS